jgi:hypothetical protein
LSLQERVDSHLARMGFEIAELTSAERGG